MSDHLAPEPRLQKKPDLPTRIEDWALKFARGMQTITMVLSYTCIMIVWLVLGLVIYLTALVCGIAILILIILVGLLVGFPVHGMLQRFLHVMTFYPEGITTITAAFWAHSSPAPETTLARTSNSSYTSGFLRVVAVLSSVYVAVCWYTGHPISTVLQLRVELLVMIVALFLLIGAGALVADQQHK